jgi:cytochrome c oxidase cbb3-type subunit I/II
MTADEIKMQALEQAVKIAEELKAQGKVAAPDTQIVALIAYLQKLGKYDTPEVEQKLMPQGVPFPLKPALPDSHRKTVSQNP